MKTASAQWESVGLVAAQLAAIAHLLLTGPWVAKHPVWVWVELAGLALALWAVWAMSPRHLRIGPEVAADARLVTRGPYRFVRHPMYLSVLLATLALVLHHFSVARLIVWLALAVVFVWKLRVEERLLADRFPEYPEYQRRTKRLIPFVY
jgi:protein-S-isoprenylcysteine O-methyltransferase Ste14